MFWEKQSLELLRQFDNYVCHEKAVFFSGGKDSLCVLHLASRAWDKFNVVYVDTGIAFPGEREYVVKVCENFNVPLKIISPKISFYDYVLAAGFPTIKRLWCRKYLKIFPIRNYKGRRVILGAVGVRKAESAHRNLLYNRYFEKSKDTHIHNVYPILHWTNKQRDAYLHHFNLPVNPSYARFGRSGCFYCPFIQEKDWLRLKAVAPELFNLIVNLEEQLQKKRVNCRPSAFLLNGDKVYARDLLKQKSLEDF